MIELTIQDIANRTNLPKEGAYSLIQFLQKAGLVNKGSGRKPKNGKGKGVSTYLMAETMPEAVREMLSKLATADGSITLPEDTALEEDEASEGEEPEEEPQPA